MQEMSTAKKQEIVDKLKEKNANHPCPRCGQKNFTLLDGYLNHVIQQELKGISLGGPSIPSVVVVCNHCGYMSQHALGVLGLLSEAGGNND